MKIVYCYKCGSKVGEFSDDYYQRRICLDCKKKKKMECELRWIKENKKRVKDYRELHINKWNANRRKKYAENKVEERKKRKLWNEKHIEKVHLVKKKCRQRQRLECLIHYSGNPPKCQCCGESQYKFLTIDHVNNNGKEHRQKVYASIIYSWLIRNDFPEEFQVLCYNCNLGKAHNNGVCPHKNRNVY